MSASSLGANAAPSSLSQSSSSRALPSLRRWSEVSHLPCFDPLLPKAAQVLQELALAGDLRKPVTSVFNSQGPPPVSMQDFLIRLCKHAHCSSQVWLCTLANADRMLTRTGMAFTSLSVHRIFLASFVVTAKFRDDVSFSNKWYAAVAGVSQQELNLIEREFLRLVDFSVDTSAEELSGYQDMLDEDGEEAVSSNGLTDESSCSSPPAPLQEWAPVQPRLPANPFPVHRPGVAP